MTTNDREPDAWELYDLANDRCESKNLRDEQPELVERLQAKWLAWAERVNAVPLPETRGGSKPIPWPPRSWPKPPAQPKGDGR